MSSQNIRELLDQIAQTLGTPPAPPAPGGVDVKALVDILMKATSDDKHERVIVRYTIGSGTFSADKRYIALRMLMYNVNGRPDGFHEGVWEALFKRPQDLLEIPKPVPTEPLNVPVGPVESPDPLARTKAHWTFGDGSKVIAMGPALTHLVQLTDGNFNFSVACSQIITSGTGLFAGVHGLKQSLGATKAGPDLFDPNKNVPFSATTIDTFRIVWPDGVPAGYNL
jgi:hypothetical protein